MTATVTAAPWALPLTTLEGRPTTLGEWRGRVLLVVNVASQCGFTPQYAGLETLWRQHRDEGFVILGVPCNQFGEQEPGDEAAIERFCTQEYQVSFPLLAKAEVNGRHTHPLYRWLKHAKPGLLGTEAIKWNFTKFLVGRDGTVLRRYAPTDTPEAIAPAVARALDR